MFHVERLHEALGELKRGLASEAAILSTCNRTELYVSRRSSPARWPSGSRSTTASRPASCSRYLYTLPQRAGGAPRLPRRLGPRFDGARRAADPRPDEGGGARRRVGRHARHACCTRCSSAPSRWRRKCAPPRSIGAASVSMAAAAVKLAARIFPSLKDQSVLLIGAGEMIELCGDALRGAGAGAPHGRQPHARARRAARHRFNARGDRAARARASTCTSTTSWCRAPPRRCRSSARAWSSARCARAAAGRCSWSTSPCRATSSRRRASSTTCSSTPSTTSPASSSANLDARRSALEQAEAIIDTQVGQLHALDAGARGRAADPRAARAGRRARAARSSSARSRRSRAARTRPRCWKRCRRTLTNKLLHVPTAGAHRDLRAPASKP